MTARQKVRKADKRTTHATGLDSRGQRFKVGARRGPCIPKPSARKTRRLITRASRRANRV